MAHLTKTHATCNIIKLRIIAACTGAVFYAALDKLLMQERGLGLTEIIALEIIVSAVVVLTEVPSGALSDRWSRKYVLALSTLFLALNIVCWAISHSFWLFVAGAVFGALAITFKSGTNTSLLYDSLRDIGKEKNYTQQLGTMRAITALSFVSAAAIGGWISNTYSISLTFWTSLPLVAIATVAALTLQEPHFHRSTDEVSYWQHIRTTVQFLITKPKLLRLASLVIAVTIPMLLIDKYAQIYFAFAGVSLLGIGLLAAVGGSIDALCNAFAHQILRTRQTTLFNVGLLIMSAGYIIAGMSPTVVGIAALFTASAAFFVVAIIAESELNHQLPSAVRATSESFFSLAETIIFIPVALLFAWIGQHYSIAVAFGSIGVLLGAYATIKQLS